MLFKRSGRSLLVWATAVAWLANMGSASAQEIGGFPLPEAPPSDKSGIRNKPEPEHLLNLDAWNELDNSGVGVKVEYTGEGATVVGGGNRKGADYAGQLHLKLDLDFATLLGLSNITVHAALVNRHGRNLSGDYLGDDILHAQEIYGGAGGVAAHLVYGYLEGSFADGMIDVEAGRLPVAHDFVSSPLYCNSLATLICGSPHAIPGDPAFTIFPNSTWGGRIRLAPKGDVHIQAGVYQVRPKFGGPTGFDFGDSGATGTYFPVEIGYLPKIGKDALPGHYKIGFTYDTSNYQDLLHDTAGNPFVLSGLAPREHEHRTSWYVLADQMVVRTGKGATSGIVLFGGYIGLDEATSAVSSIAFAGVHAKGVIADRPADSLNVLLGQVRMSEALSATQALQEGLGLPLANQAEGIQRRERLAEINYDVHVTDGVHLIPDLQYIKRPNATFANRSALIGAMRIAITL